MKLLTKALIGVVGSGAFLGAFSGTPSLAAAVSETALRQDIEALCRPELNGRLFGSREGRQAARYVAGRFKAIGLEPMRPGYRHPFIVDGRKGINILGRLRGKGKAPRATLILEAHFDHVGSLSPGAADNAAGVAVVLEAARLLKSALPLEKDVIFASFDGEEEGFLGAMAYVKNSPIPLSRTAGFIVLDAMGRRFGDLPDWHLFAFGGESSPQFHKLLKAKQKESDHLELLSTRIIGPRSDYVPFQSARVPHLFFFNGTYPEYHGPGDTVDRLNISRLADDGGLIIEIVRNLARHREKPVYVPAKSLPSDLPTVRSLWTKMMTPRPSLPASLSAEVPDLSAALQAQSASDKELARAFDVICAAATPWFGEMMVLDEAGKLFQRRGDRRAAAMSYRRAASVVRSPVGKRYFGGLAAALDKEKSLPTSPPSRDQTP